MSLSVADAHLISMRSEMTGIVVPGKLYGVMASGRPAIFVGPRHCETADTIRAAGSGMTVDRGDVAGLVAALTRLAGDAALARRMGERGRSAFLAGFEQKLCCRQWRDLIDELIGGEDQAAARPTRPTRGVRRAKPRHRPVAPAVEAPLATTLR